MEPISPPAQPWKTPENLPASAPATTMWMLSFDANLGHTPIAAVLVHGVEAVARDAAADVVVGDEVRKRSWP